MIRLRHLLVLLAFPFVLLSPSVSPAVNGATRPTSYLVRIPFKGAGQIVQLEERGIEIVNFSPRGYIDVATDEKGMRELLSRGYSASVLASSDMPSSSPALDANLGLYHTYAEMESDLMSLASTYPSIAKLDTIGTSHEGRNIYCLEVSDNVSIDENEPEVLFVGCHHARELMSVEIPMELARYLLENYGSDPTVTALVDAREIFFVPMLNPDGHVYVENNHSGAWWTWWRKNRRDNGDGTYGVDLNRNYPYMWGLDDFGSSPYTYSEIYRGPGPLSEPETQALRDLVSTRSFVLAFSYHSYGELLLYPWGYDFMYTPDHALFRALGDTLTASNGYLAGNSATGAIYIVNGEWDDWAYGETGTKNRFFSFTPEVNSSSEGGFGPPDTLIAPTFDLLLPMNMLLLELADGPHRILGPARPVMYPIDTSPMGSSFLLSWSASPPSDPNPAVSYDIVQFENLYHVTDNADTLSPHFLFDGFVLGTRAYQGTGSYYSQSGDNLSNTLTTAVTFPVTTDNDTLTCMVWYDIEPDYDYAYLEYSDDDGLTWNTLPGNITTDFDPHGVNHGNGITGSSGGWVQAIFPLDGLIGSDIQLRFHYITDGAVSYEGFYVDLLDPVPAFEAETLMASAHPDTTLLVSPQHTGTFTYRVRARDAEGDLSLWSTSVTHTVDQIVGTGSIALDKSSLGRNYPDPFNPVTTIPYVVGTRGGAKRVELAVYGVDGRLIARLFEGTRPPGVYRALWDGRDLSGQPVASGVYFARLSIAGEGLYTEKLVLLK